MLYAYDAVGVLLQAIQVAKPIDNSRPELQKVLRAIRTRPYAGALGTLRWDGNGDLMTPPYVIYVAKRGGSVQGWFEQLVSRRSPAGKTPREARRHPDHAKFVRPPRRFAVKTHLIAVNPKMPQPEVIQRAVETLRRGGLVAFPTDTLYALGADALALEAIERVLTTKGRHHGKPLSVLVATVDAAEGLTSQPPTVFASSCGASGPAR